MDILYLDTETYSPINITQCGTHKYVENAELLLLSYALNEEPVQVWDATRYPMPIDLTKYLRSEVYVCAHNSAFDRTVLRELLHIDIPPAKWIDTMVLARRYALPAKLKDLCKLYRLPISESKKDGSKGLRLFTKPQSKSSKIKRYTRINRPQEWNEFMEYAKLDTVSMRKILKLLPTWNNSEREKEVWCVDQIINDKGVKIDITLAEKAVVSVNSLKEKNNNLIETLTRTGEGKNSYITTLGQRDKIMQYVYALYGYKLPDFTRSTIERCLMKTNPEKAVKDILLLRLENSKSSTKKYEKVLRSVSKDGHLRGMLNYCGASRTGRWTSPILQTLPRPTIDEKEILDASIIVKSGLAELVYGKEVPGVCSSLVRSLFVADEGYKFVVSDFSSIEGVCLAWLAGEQWKVEAYTAYFKGEGYDMYTLTYANVFGIDPKEVTKSQRQLGKVLELALGYGGGIGAFQTFASVYGVDLAELNGKIEVPECHRRLSLQYYDNKGAELLRSYDVDKDTFVTCDGIKRMWRDNNSLIETLWSAVEYETRVLASLKAGSQYTHEITLPFSRLTFSRKGMWGLIRLPSGRYLNYPGLHISGSGDITYRGIDAFSRKWQSITTWGGKIVENIIQAIAGDVLRFAILNAMSYKYNVKFTVHDEIVTQTPDTPEYSIDTLNKIMVLTEPWMKGLPLNAEGYEGYHYKK